MICYLYTRRFMVCKVCFFGIGIKLWYQHRLLSIFLKVERTWMSTSLAFTISKCWCNNQRYEVPKYFRLSTRKPLTIKKSSRIPNFSQSLATTNLIFLPLWMYLSWIAHIHWIIIVWHFESRFFQVALCFLRVTHVVL